MKVYSKTQRQKEREEARASLANTLLQKREYYYKRIEELEETLGLEVSPRNSLYQMDDEALALHHHGLQRKLQARDKVTDEEALLILD